MKAESAFRQKKKGKIVLVKLEACNECNEMLFRFGYIFKERKRYVKLRNETTKNKIYFEKNRFTILVISLFFYFGMYAFKLRAHWILSSLNANIWGTKELPRVECYSLSLMRTKRHQVYSGCHVKYTSLEFSLYSLQVVDLTCCVTITDVANQTTRVQVSCRVGQGSLSFLECASNKLKTQLLRV